MDAHTYAYRRHRRVQGWLNDVSARVILDVGQWQHNCGIYGAVGEIGVHHGRLFILLDLLRTRGEKAFAIDIFDDQSSNVERSGRGEMQSFLRNVSRHGGECPHLFIKSSTDVAPDEITGAVGAVRLFSIDGGHTEGITCSDLRLAQESLVPGGLVVLDDVFNSGWPGVVTGLSEYLAAEDSSLVPVAASPNKVYLTDRSYADAYRSAFGAMGKHAPVKHGELFGSPIVIHEKFPSGLRGILRRAHHRTIHRPLIGRPVERLTKVLRERRPSWKPSRCRHCPLR